MRHNVAFHEYEALFYIGIPLIFFSQVFGLMQRRFGTALIAGVTVAAVAVFVLSGLQMSRVVHDAETVSSPRKVIADFEVIRRLTSGKKVLNAYITRYNKILNRRPSVDFYLTGSILHHHWRNARRDQIPPSFDFIITPLRSVEGANLLTPENRLVFLYEGDGFLDAYRSRSFGRLLVRSNFDVYLDGDVLRYVQNPCSLENLKAPFFLHVIPVDVEDLPDHRRRYEFDNLDFSFRQYRQDLGVDGSCEAAVALPEYAVASIRTGQYLPNGSWVWGETFSLAGEAEVPAAEESLLQGEHRQAAES